MTADRARCVVLGGSGALGRVVCRSLAAQGERVGFTYWRGEDAARELCTEIPEAISRRVDLSSRDAVEESDGELAEGMGGIDAFVQCAGVAVTVESDDPKAHQRIEDVDERGWDLMLDVNVKSTFFAIRRLAPIMSAGGGGNIVLVGSIDGVKPVPSPVHYAASKGALVGMTSALSKELGPGGIRVNTVAPGIMDGGVSRAIPDDLRAEYLKHCGLKRVGRLSEIAAVVAWMATRNTYVTGQTILVDGAL
jgi:3-oxoacyl-[acyl-carrier protein] reductase